MLDPVSRVRNLGTAKLGGPEALVRLLAGAVVSSEESFRVGWTLLAGSLTVLVGRLQFLTRFWLEAFIPHLVNLCGSVLVTRQLAPPEQVTQGCEDTPLLESALFIP